MADPHSDRAEAWLLDGEADSEGDPERRAQSKPLSVSTEAHRGGIRGSSLASARSRVRAGRSAGCVDKTGAPTSDPRSAAVNLAPAQLRRNGPNLGLIEIREGRRSPYRVRRLAGRLTASFTNRAAAELQDALWGRWGEQIPTLADKEPRLSRALETRLLGGASGRAMSPALLSTLLAAHPERSRLVPESSDDDSGPLLGEYVVDFFPKWAAGKVTLRGSSEKPKARKTIEIVQDGLHRIVFETRWKPDEHDLRMRDDNGRFIDLGWGESAAAWIPLRD